MEEEYKLARPSLLYIYKHHPNHFWYKTKPYKKPKIYSLKPQISFSLSPYLLHIMEAEKLAKPSLLHRRIGVVSRSLDLELISIANKNKVSLPTYTSLKDVLPFSAAVNSPSASSSATVTAGISIRNRLVKQAAAAYLHPSTPTLSPAPSFLHRISASVLRLFVAVFDAFLRLFPSPRNIFKS